MDDALAANQAKEERRWEDQRQEAKTLLDAIRGGSHPGSVHYNNPQATGMRFGAEPNGHDNMRLLERLITAAIDEGEIGSTLGEVLRSTLHIAYQATQRVAETQIQLDGATRELDRRRIESLAIQFLLRLECDEEPLSGIDV